MKDHHGILPGFDHFIEIADRPFAHRPRQWTILPLCAVMANQEAAHQVAGRQVVMAGHRDERPPEAPRHVLHKARLAASRWPLEQHRQAPGVALLEDADLFAGRNVIWLLSRAGHERRLDSGRHALAADPGMGRSFVSSSAVTTKRGAYRKKSAINSMTPMAKMEAVAISITKCTCIFNWVSR